jgi:hypothetical protein
MKRRILLLSRVSVVATGAQVRARLSAAQPRLALLVPDPSIAADPVSGRLAPFLAALRELGDIGGQSIRLDFRFAENRLDLLPGLAAELANGQPEVIYTYTIGHAGVPHKNLHDPSHSSGKRLLPQAQGPRSTATTLPGAGAGCLGNFSRFNSSNRARIVSKSSAARGRDMVR